MSTPCAPWTKGGRKMWKINILYTPTRTSVHQFCYQADLLRATLPTPTVSFSPPLLALTGSHLPSTTSQANPDPSSLQQISPVRLPTHMDQASLPEVISGRKRRGVSERQGPGEKNERERILHSCYSCLLGCASRGEREMEKNEKGSFSLLPPPLFRADVTG